MEIEGIVIIGAALFVLAFFIGEMLSAFQCELHRLRTGEFSEKDEEYKEQYKEWLIWNNLPDCSKTEEIFKERIWNS